MATKAMLQFIVTTGNSFTSFCFDSGRDSPEKLVFATYVYSVTLSSKLVQSAVQVICIALRRNSQRVTAVEALKAPAVRTVYLSEERSRQCGALQQLANDTSRVN